MEKDRVGWPKVGVKDCVVTGLWKLQGSRLDDCAQKGRRMTITLV